LYLLTLMICFDSDTAFRRRIFYPLHFLVILGLLYFNGFVRDGNFQALIFLYCLAVFTTGMIAHGELARSKPANQHLTAFYLAMAAGGALGGALVGLVAPAVLHDLHEFRITLVVTFLFVALALAKDSESWLRRGSFKATAWIFAATALALVPAIKAILPWVATNRSKNGFIALLLFLMLLFAAWIFTRRFDSNNRRHPFIYAFYLIFVAAVGIGFTAHSPFKKGRVVLTERNFFGVKRVAQDDTTVLMTHGSTLHGVAYIAREKRDFPMSYYSNDSGIALLFRNFPRDTSRGLRVGVIGLGAGVLASYGKPGDSFRFYEIDPQVVKIAQGQNSYFHFVEDSHASSQFSEGDARINLEEEIRQQHIQQFDILILDAFSGDSVPMHLLTREAMQVYLQHLRGKQSVIAVHISNRYIDLKPVLDALARNYTLRVAYLPARDSHWVLLSQSGDVFATREIKQATFNSFLTEKPVLWADDYSNLLPLL
jgi:spermidine synthase